MDIGVGLPSMIPGAEGVQLLEWSVRAEGRGFSSVTASDRLVYDNYEPLVALAAAGAVTTTIGLATVVLVAPYRANAALIAKAARSLNRLTDGRFTLGAAVGARRDDYAASKVEFHTRGQRFDQMLQEWHRIWKIDDSDGGASIDANGRRLRPNVVLGGSAPQALDRVARYADGWVMGGGSPDKLRESASKLQTAWVARQRPGSPKLMAIGYFALGPNARERADAYLRHYYAFLGAGAAGVASRAATDATAVRRMAAALADAGCDELILLPCDPQPDQVDRLADTIF